MSVAPPFSADPLVALADRCVQCGLCLPACPTYGRERLEAESPRGRIALTRALALDTLVATAVADTHLDHCLGCRSCEAVCPAGVEYGALLTLARQRQRERRPARWRQRLIEALAARPRWLGAGLAVYRIAYPWLPSAWRPLPRPPQPVALPAPPVADDHHTVPADPPTRAGLFLGCVATAYESPLRAAVVRLCAQAGTVVEASAGQTCCGALHAHSGDTAHALTLAEANRAAFAGQTTVLTLASGCHDSLGHALGGGTRAVDAIVHLADRAARLRFRATAQRVALHLPCTQRNVVKSVPALRRLLAAVPGLEVIELDAGYGCCGASGTQMLADPPRAAEYREPLLAQFAVSGASVLLSANIGCRLHLANGTALPVLHPLEFLATCLEERSPAV